MHIFCSVCTIGLMQTRIQQTFEMSHLIRNCWLSILMSSWNPVHPTSRTLLTRPQWDCSSNIVVQYGTLMRTVTFCLSRKCNSKRQVLLQVATRGSQTWSTSFPGPLLFTPQEAREGRPVSPLSLPGGVKWRDPGNKGCKHDQYHRMAVPWRTQSNCLPCSYVQNCTLCSWCLHYTPPAKWAKNTSYFSPVILSFVI